MAIYHDDGVTMARRDLERDIACGLALEAAYVCEWLSLDHQTSLWLGEGATPQDARHNARQEWADRYPEKMAGTLIVHRLVDHPEDVEA